MKKAHLVGHSFGAAIALLAAIERPDLVLTLTLGEPSPFLGLFDAAERHAAVIPAVRAWKRRERETAGRRLASEAR